MSGFVIMHREVLEHPFLAKDAARLGAWFWLIAKANWKPTKFDISGKTVALDRGQFCASRSQLAEAWGWSPSAVERFLSRLETEQMIERATGQGRTVVTIRNYDKYQAVSDATGQASGQATEQRSDSDRTTKEQGNKGTREEEPFGSPSQGAGEPGHPQEDFGDLLGGEHSRPEKPKRKRADEPFSLPVWVPSAEWDAFLEMRAKMKKSPTERALKLLVGELEKLRRDGHDPGDVLNQSTMKNWIGLFKLKESRDDHRNGYGAGTGTRYQPDGAMAYLQQRLGIEGDPEPAGAAGRWDDGPASRGHRLPDSRD